MATPGALGEVWAVVILFSSRSEQLSCTPRTGGHSYDRPAEIPELIGCHTHVVGVTSPSPNSGPPGEGRRQPVTLVGPAGWRVSLNHRRALGESRHARP